MTLKTNNALAREKITYAMQGDLEHLIDLCGLEAVIEAIRTICYEKAEHVQTNWQDKQLAKVWERCAKATDKLGAVAATLP